MPENEFDYNEHLRASLEAANRLFTGWLIERLREEDEFDKAWNKRAKEVAELERLFSL